MGSIRIRYTLHLNCIETKKDWLRSEIEKMEVEIQDVTNDGWGGDSEVYNKALTSIITRYKEELLELEK